MKMVKIGFFILIFSSFCFSQVTNHIVIYPDSERIAISKYVFGSGDEMNACFSPLSQTRPLIAATKPSLLRFGGIGAEYLDWEGDNFSGISYVDFVDTLIIPQPVHFGVDSFLRLCEDISSEPILTVNMQTGDTALARRMVEYANGDTLTPMGQLRAQRGHPEPYNVTLWSLGNEPDIAGGQWPTPPWGYWTFYRHFGIPFADWSWQDSSFWMPQDFANLIPLYVGKMEGASPIPLSFIFSMAGNLSWIRPVIEPNINLIDYLDFHYYPTGVFDSIADTTDYIEWLSNTDTIFPAEPYAKLFADTLAAIGASSIKPVCLEYNAGIIIVPDALWWNYLDGLFIADCIGHWMHQGLEMAAVYSIHEGNPGSTDFPYFGVIRGDTASRRMASYVLEMYNTYFGDTLIYSYSDHKNTGYGIEAWSSKRSSDGKYVVEVINKTLDTTYATTIQLKDSIQSFHLLNITNDAAIAAPFNGTTGIVDRGVFPTDSIRNGWSYLTQSIIPASISLFEAVPYLGVKKIVSGGKKSIKVASIVRRGTTFKVGYNSYSLFSVSGREICRWNNTETITVPFVARGVYFLKTQGRGFKKLVLF